MIRQLLVISLVLVACGDDNNECFVAFEKGDDGNASPLTVAAGQASAGKLVAADLPNKALAQWEPGDFVIANENVAMVIEDVGVSNLYDPWGGRPVGIAAMDNGAMVRPATLGEIFFATGRETVLTEHVGVLNDGSNGEAAVIRVTGRLSPIPFAEGILSLVYRDTYEDIETAIDYELKPGSNHVDVYKVHNCSRDRDVEIVSQVHGFMFTKRTGLFAPGYGFDAADQDVDWIAQVAADETGYIYESPSGQMDAGIAAAGFYSTFTEGVTIEACGTTRRHLARITIGGPGINELQAAREGSDFTETVSGTVTFSDGSPAAGARVHFQNSEGYLTRVLVDANGNFTAKLPDDGTLTATAYLQNQSLAGPMSTSGTLDLVIPDSGTIQVSATEGGSPVPARIQILPVSEMLPRIFDEWGEARIMQDRHAVEYTVDGMASIPVPPGTWKVIVSRGFEYDIHEQDVVVTAGQTASVAAPIARVVDSTGIMCADYHIHTHFSPDSEDPIERKLRAVVADGLEIPVRSDHEWVGGFADDIAAMGLSNWAFGLPSIEVTTVGQFGHFGVVPLEPLVGERNNGAPEWIAYPTNANLEKPVELVKPPELFPLIKSRPESPAIIINHPRGMFGYFDNVAYDRVSGEGREGIWDSGFDSIEVFNDSGWLSNRNRTVEDWFSFLNRGEKKFAVGSSDSHDIVNTPVGYPRTCLQLGTDVPSQLTNEAVRDATTAGHSVISGGILVTVDVASKGPGETATGVGAMATVNVTLQAPSWVSVEAIEFVVDGQTLEDRMVLPTDADPLNPTIRYTGTFLAPVDPSGSYVVVAAYSSGTLAPVFPGEKPFGVSNPIFLEQ